jgi:hypothetical protein
MDYIEKDEQQQQDKDGNGLWNFKRIVTIKSTALIYEGYPLLTEHYCLETLDQLWNEVSPTRSFVCRFQVVLSHGYINFPTFDYLWQRLSTNTQG